MSLKDDIEKVFRCKECNLVPLINYYLGESDDTIEQEVSIKCRNNHSEEDIDFEEFLESYISEEKEKNIDSICEKHNEKIIKICEKCDLNLCNKCSHDCKEVIDISKFALSQKEKDDIKENFEKFNPFFEKLKKLIRSDTAYQYFYDKNKKLLSFAEIIYSTYLKYEKDNKLSYEIIRNCRYCLKFKYKELSLENDSTNVIRSQVLPMEVELFLKLSKSDGYRSRKIDLYTKPKNYIIMPSNNIDKSKYKLLTDYEIDIKFIKSRYYSSFAELLDDKFAMVDGTSINIFKNDSLNILYTIEIDVKVDEDDYRCQEKITSLFCLQNGNLMASTYDGKIYIFKIMDDKYEKILEFEHEERFFSAIELQNKKLLTFTSNKNVIIFYYDKKSNNYKLETKIEISCSPGEMYSVKLIDLKDSQKVMIITRKEMGYLNYIKGNYETKFVCSDSWYEFDVSLFHKNLLLESNKNIYIRDRKSLEKKCFFELDDSYQYDANLTYELKDGSFLCGMSNKYNNILRQYVYNNNNIIELSKLSFAGYKDNFEFIHQLKNGNIICSMSSEEYFMLK